MKAGHIQKELLRTNRWWRDTATWTRDDEDLNRASLAPFHYTAGVLDNLTPGGLYTLSGPRRVGKSVAVKQTIKRLLGDGVHPASIAHMSVDGWRVDDLPDLADSVQQVSPWKGRRYWFIDEITGVLGKWPYRIKWLRDNYPGFRDDTVVLTGSSSSDLRMAMGVLAGRHGRASDPYRALLPMGFRSFAAQIGMGRNLPDDVGPLRIADLRRPHLEENAYGLVPWFNDLTQAWEIYLQVGGFPEGVAGYLGNSPTRLPDELFRIISRGAFRWARMSDLQSRILLQLLTEGLCSPANVADLARELDVMSDTMKQRLDELRESFVIWPAHRERRGHAQLRARFKIYFTDPAYARLADDDWLDLSVLSEQQLGMVLLRNLERNFPGSYIDSERVLYHRTGAGAEIDFVGPDFGGVAIESNYVDDYGWRRGTLRTLKASPWEGIVATRGLLDLSDPQVAAVPAAFLAWLLDN